MNDAAYVRDTRSPSPLSAVVSKVMRANKAKDTSLETSVRKAFCAAGHRHYRLNYKRLPGKPDIVFVRERLIVFVHGCFWHGCVRCGKRVPKHNKKFWADKIARNKRRDQRNVKVLRKDDWKVTTIWEHDVKKDARKAVSKALKLLDEKI